MSLECEGRGAVCSFDGCGLFDFLPTPCVFCSGVYCSEHAIPVDHACAHENGSNINELPASSSSPRPPRSFLSCAACGETNIFVTVCSVCGQAACVSHRFDHRHESSAFPNVVDRPLGATPEPKITVGPLPAAGARGQETILFFSGGSEPQGGAISTANDLSWCRGVVGLGGSGGKLCDDVLQITATSVPSDAARQCSLYTVAALPSAGGCGGGVGEQNRQLHVSSMLGDDVSSLLVLREVQKHQIAQDFMRDQPLIGLFFWMWSPDGNECNQTAMDNRALNLLSAGVTRDKELMRRIQLIILSSRGRTMPSTQLDASSVPSLEPSGSTSAVPVAAEDTVVIDDSGAPLVSHCAFNDINALRFASTKTAPRGLSAVKSSAKRFIAVLMAHRNAIKSADGFVIVVDAAWPRGKLLDRVLDESVNLGCPRDPGVYATLGTPTLALAPSSAPYVWGLVHLPSSRLICYQGDRCLASSCEDLVEDKGAMILVAVPPSMVAAATEGPKWLTVASTMRCMETAKQSADAKRVKYLQMKECSLM